ncbi:MAG: putative toxin-antitoxin system toxin component, PIN family [Burkholderiales bacterium]
MRVVLDTNVVLSAILFETSHLSWLRPAWAAKTIIPVVDKSCADELLRVLAYPKFQLTRNEIEALLGGYLPYTETVQTASFRPRDLPRCRDPHDQKFLMVAAAGKAVVMVTGDKALLELNGQTRFAIETPRQFRNRLKV